MKSWIIILCLLIVLLNIANISAEVQLLCLEDGETVEFSLCNSAITDRTCDSSRGCQYCVDEIENGVYCPVHINKCNSEGLVCEIKDSGFQTVELKTNNTVVRNNNNNNNNNLPTLLDEPGKSIVTGGSLGTRISVGDNNSSGTTGNEEYFQINIKKSYLKYFGLGVLPIVEFIVLFGLLYYDKKKVLVKKTS